MRSCPFILLVLASLPACQDYKLKGGDAEPARTRSEALRRL